MFAVEQGRRWKERIILSSKRDNDRDGREGWMEGCKGLALHMGMYPRHQSYDASARTEGERTTTKNLPQFLFNMQHFSPPYTIHNVSLIRRTKTYRVGLDASPPSAVQKYWDIFQCSLFRQLLPTQRPPAFKIPFITERGCEHWDPFLSKRSDWTEFFHCPFSSGLSLPFGFGTEPTLMR